MLKKTKAERRTSEGGYGVAEIEAVRRWFKGAVTYEGEPYAVDAEQAAAIIDDSKNTIVVARAGSGKTRTIVAKIVYLVAKCGVRPEEIMVFVFNANAAREINARLEKMCVDGVPVMGVKNEVEVSGDNEKVSEGSRAPKMVKIASTFHAFSRKVVYEVCGGKEKCGKILAGEKEDFVAVVVQRMLGDSKWREKILHVVRGEAEGEIELAGERGKVVASKSGLDNDELERFAKMMAQFINRAQQKYLGGEKTLSEVAREYLKNPAISSREREFVEIGVECFRRYHWYLLNGDGRRRLRGFGEYGTDFNLVVSWASKMIASGREEVRELLEQKKYILVDEYQDFSQLFLAAVKAVRGVAQEAKLFVVGDDWQAINRFAGSDVEYFKEFEKFFSDGVKRLMISTNYRCDYEIVDMARQFMKKAMREGGRFRAFSRRAGKVALVDPDETELTYGFVDYDRRVSEVDRKYKTLVRRVLKRTPKEVAVKYFKTIAGLICANRGREILILHRNNETNIDGVSLERLGAGLKMILEHFKIMDGAEFDEKVSLMTIHKSKGLEAEVVIMLDADEGTIPRVHPDTSLYGVFGETEAVALNDQKRLFYVAMTRAKHRLYIIHRQDKGEGFIKYMKNLQKRC